MVYFYFISWYLYDVKCVIIVFKEFAAYVALIAVLIDWLIICIFYKLLFSVCNSIMVNHIMTKGFAVWFSNDITATAFLCDDSVSSAGRVSTAYFNVFVYVWLFSRLIIAVVVVVIATIVTITIFVMVTIVTTIAIAIVTSISIVVTAVAVAIVVIVFMLTSIAVASIASRFLSRLFSSLFSRLACYSVVIGFSLVALSNRLFSLWCNDVSIATCDSFLSVFSAVANSSGVWATVGRSSFAAKAIS